MPLDRQSDPPAETQANPYLPPGTQPLTVEVFGGVNTATTRAGVPDEMLYWMDGFFPQAPRNARVMYGSGTAIYTAVGKTVVWFDFANISSTPYAILFLSDGSVVAVNTTTTATTTILTASSITSPTILNCGMKQWGSQYVIIVANQTNGYWLWDGNSTFQSGTLSPVVTITNAGSGYGSSETVVFTGGHGSGASANVSISGGAVASVSLISPGTGYSIGDIVIGGLTPAPAAGTGASLTGSISGGTLVSLSIVAGGSGYGPNASVSFTVASAPGVTAPSAFPILTGGTLTNTSITSRGSGLTGVTVGLVDTAINATLTFQLMPFGVSGTCVETYSGHVWVAKGPTVYFTAPGSVADFSIATGGGNFTSSDSYLKVGYSRLFQSNGFLYLVADSSVDYISGVQTAGTPPVTTYTKQNADPETGSPYPQSVILQGQNLMFANSIGIYTLNGAKANKVSDYLDNTYNSVANFGGNQLSGASADIFGRKCWMELVDIVDPVSGVTGTKLLIWDGKRWWASAQDISLTYVKHQEINSVITAYGTNGTVVSPLFSTPSTGFQKTIQSRYWDVPGAILTNKANNRFFGAFNYYSASASTNLIVTVDSVGVGASGQFTNSQGYTITGPTVTGYFITPPQAVGQQGVFNGLTLKTNASDMSAIEMQLVPVDVGYRG